VIHLEATMNEQEARAECERLGREHPARGEFAWFPKEVAPGEWTVVRVPASGLRVDHGRTVATHDPAPARPNPELDPPVAPKPYWGGA
jgi:hypothetical protein